MTREISRRFLVAVLPFLAVSAFGQETQPADVVSILSKRCSQCHGEALQMGNLDTRTREALIKGGSKGPAVIPGKAEQSLLFRRVAGMDEPKMPMAPQQPLTPQEIAVLKSWIDQGARWTPSPSTSTIPSQPADPASSYAPGYKPRPITEQDRNWWAFRPPVRQPQPRVSDARWARNPIDAFVFKAMNDKGLVPAPPVDRRTLVRRVYLDLIGLLPAPADVEAFVNDKNPAAYEALVERLLASPRYGERWGRFWLDVARYADSSGYEMDRDQPSAWRYRDYVIKAFNEDKPFNRFIQEQIAGDELDDVTNDSLIATAFHSIGPRVRYREKDSPEYRYSYLDDQIRTTFQGFLGLTVHCARCHDHKFDPITRLDYYKTMGMFNGSVYVEHPLVPVEQGQEYQRAKAAVDAETKSLRDQIAAIEKPYKEKLFQAKLKTFPADIQLAVNTPAEQRTPGQKLLASQVILSEIDIGATGRNSQLELSEVDTKLRGELQAKVREVEKKAPPTPPLVEGIRDGDFRLTPDAAGDEDLPGKGNRYAYGVKCCFLPQTGKSYEVPPVHFGADGLNVDADLQKPVVAPGFLTVLTKEGAPVADPPKNSYYGAPTSGRRRALAEWIASQDNPLTARVIVNRLWYWHFGRGIVATPGNFGKMGVPPSHPELLDWLATEFVSQGWSIKRIHRLIMLSETYKMASSFYNAANVEKDGPNIYLWKFPARRLEAEAIRDVILEASGQLNLQAGGEPFFPAIDDRLRQDFKVGKWVAAKEGPATWRRSVYSYWKRGFKVPMFEVHDQPDPMFTAEMRNVTTVPTQALVLLNGEFTLLQVRHFAARIAREAGNDPAEQVKTLYRIALGREPAQKELDANLAFLQKLHGMALPKALDSGSAPKADDAPEISADLAALADLAHVVINSNEFVYIN